MSCSRTQHGDPSGVEPPTSGSGVRGVNHQYRAPLEKEETEAVFFHATLFTKMERRHRMTKCKANFCEVKVNRKKYGNKVLTNQNTAQ